MARILLVTDELYPFTNGGIGRLVHNLLKQEQRRGINELHVMVPARRGLKPADLDCHFGTGLTLHPLEFVSPQPSWWHKGWLWLGRRAANNSRARNESRAVHLALKSLHQRGLGFDVIEFPDYFGWAYDTLRHRDLGATRIVVRLHGSRGVISEQAGLSNDANEQQMIRQERYCATHADLRVAHLGTVRTFLAQHFQLEESSIALSFPPVLETPNPPTRTRPRDTPNFWFLSKIDHIKNPELFIDGCVSFFEHHDDYQGRAIFACHNFEPAYTEQLKTRIPERLMSRFLFRGPLSAAERAELKGHVVVITSVFETLCLLAYEALADEAIVCLNQACPAFSGAPWTESNCVRFAPTSTDLLRALEQAAFGCPELETTIPAPDLPYWG